jgi:hypothetical protein
MMMLEREPLIVCPSAGRAGRVKVFRLLPDIPLCVPAREEEAYRRAYPDAQLLVHPDDLVGLSPKRQWLLDRYGDVFWLDDDVTVMSDLTKGAGEAGGRVEDPATVRGLIMRLFDQAEQMGAYLVAFASFASPEASRPQKPFHLTGFAAGRAFGVRSGGGLVFPNRVLITDDLYISALNAHRNRFMLRDERYAFMAPGTWTNAGGMNAHRSWERMIENNRLMVDLFGEDVIVKKTGTFKAKIKHDAQLALKVPW